MTVWAKHIGLRILKLILNQAILTEVREPINSIELNKRPFYMPTLAS